MLRSLWNGASALNSQQIMLDSTANNISNANTTGYKKQQVSFADLLYDSMAKEGHPVENSEAQNGTGTRVTATTRDFKPGVIVNTRRPLDVAIDGDGFFQVSLPNGDKAYFRSGSLMVDARGVLVNEDGYKVTLVKEDGSAATPEETIPAGYKNIIIDRDGLISVETKEGSNTPLGHLRLYKFQNPAGLLSMGNNLFKATADSGTATEGTPGRDGIGTLQSGALEMSNVNLVEEMAQIIEAQRAYQINLRSVQAADEMWNIANNIRK